MRPRCLQLAKTCLLFLVGLALVCPNLAAEELRRTGVTPNASPGIAMLKRIEDRVLPLPLVTGVPRNESLSDYYWDANPGLRYRVDEAVRAFTSGKPAPFRALTLVAGTAGVGKTFVKRSVYSDSVPDETIWKFDIRELLGEWVEQQLAELKPDVCHGDRVINRLLSFTPEGRHEFVRQLEAKSSAFVVVDSLDEIHPDDYFFVLETLERFALHGAHDFIHVAVFARPLAFREYWRDRHSKGLPYGLAAYVLDPPDFRTTGDLCVSSWNYHCWKDGLSRVGADGQNRRMSFSDFQYWYEDGFPTTGDFANVTRKGNSDIRPEVDEELERWTRQHRVVLGVLPNLAGNSILREIVEANVLSGKEFDEREFMDEFFARWLERDTKTDDRPSRLKPEHLELYVKLLEAVAAKYIDEDRVDRLGYFDVVDDDRVVVEHDGSTVSVFVRQLLNRSGLVSLDPILPEAQRYRFEPFWIHRLLFQMHLERESRQGERPTSLLIPAQ